MRRFRFLLLLSLCLLLACTSTVQRSDGTVVRFSESRAKTFDSDTYRGTVWESHGQSICVSEQGTVLYRGYEKTLRLCPDGDQFRLLLQLFRSIPDETPVLELPAGTARLRADGDAAKFELLTNPLQLDYRGNETGIFVKTEESEYRPIESNSIARLQSHPNTEWKLSKQTSPIERLDLKVGADGAVSGAITLNDQPIACELLFGESTRDNICALVKQNATGLDDLLLLAAYQKGKGDSDRIVTRVFQMHVICDPQGFFKDADDPKTLLLDKRVTNQITAPEENWMGMNVHELLFLMEEAGWKGEDVRLFDLPYPCFYRLVKDDQTILVGAEYLWSQGFADECVTGYVHYAGRTVLSWGGYPPVDHVLAESCNSQPDVNPRKIIGNSGYIGDMSVSVWFLDDGRVAAMLISYPPSGDSMDIEYAIFE